MPICVVYTLFLVWQGMPQTLGAYVDATTLEGAKQTIAVGPVASQVAIKIAGTMAAVFFMQRSASVRESDRAANFTDISIATCEATGPTAMVCLAPSSVVAST